MTSFNLSVCIAPSMLWPPGVPCSPEVEGEGAKKVRELPLSPKALLELSLFGESRQMAVIREFEKYYGLCLTRKNMEYQFNI